MTQDRTRAIVEAAEKLAKAIALRVDDKLPNEADYDVVPLETEEVPDGPAAHAAMLALARALALPQAPPVPESSLRALLTEALPYLTSHCDEGPAGQGWSSKKLDGLCARIEAALALPESEAPKWIRCAPNECAPLSVLADPRPYLYRHREPGSSTWSYGVDNGTEAPDFPIEHESEWWPVSLDYAVIPRRDPAPESEAPPVRDEARRDAIVRAAEEMIRRMGIEVVGTDRVAFTRGGENTLEALFALASAVQAPAPKWTRTPPTASGTYWLRSPDGGVEAVEATVIGDRFSVYTPGSDVALSPEDLDGYAWFPVPIEPPKETPDVL